MRWGKLKGWSSFSGSEGAGSPIIGSIGVRRTESRREREWMNDLGVKVVFQPSGRRGRVERGISLVEASRQLGADIEALCGGKRLCGKCKVRIEEGVYQKMGILSCLSHVSAWQEEEEKFITREEKEAGFRLACCARVLDDVLIYVPEESRTGKQIVSKAARHIPIRHNPAVRLYYLEISPPSLDEPAADLERVLEEMDRQHGLSDLKIDLNGLQQLSPALRDGDWQVTLSIWMDQEIIGVRPGKRDASYGLAVDVGTTSVAGYLCNLKTMEVVDTVTFMNPQCRYGEDVMSRITYHMSNEEGLALMHREIVEGLNVMVERAVEGKIPRMGREDIEDMTLVGNTVMHHILLNLNPEYVGRVPFPPAVHRGLDFKARDLGIKIHPGAHVHLLPIEAGFVGADNVGVLIAARPYRSDEIQLIIDIGTNGELVLGNREKMICSSCATGPALEGAQLRFGMRAAAGAIERVRIDPGTHEVDYKVIGHDGWRSFSVPKEMNAKGICGSGILDVLAELFRSGIITKSGAFSREERSKRFRKNPETGQGEFVLAWVGLSRAHIRMYWWYDHSAEHLAEAERAVKQASNLRPDLPEVHEAWGWYYYHGRLQYDQASRHFAIAQKGQPKNSGILTGIGYVKARQGETQEALISLKEAYQLNPYAALAAILAYNLVAMGEYSEAEEYYDRAIFLAPDEALAYQGKARLYIVREGDIKGARTILNEASQNVGDTKELRDLDWHIVFVEMCAEEYDRALEQLSLRSEANDTMLSFTPRVLKRAEIYWCIGRNELAKRDYESARGILEAKIREQPEDDRSFRYHSALGIAYAGLGQEQEAIRAHQRSVELRQKYGQRGSRQVRDLARIYAMVGKPDEAIDQIEILLEKPPGLSIPLLRIDPIWIPLREHPGFKKLLQSSP